MSTAGLNLSGITSIVGIIVGLLGLVTFLGVAGVFIVVVVANRAEPDPSGRRPLVVYLFGVAFITLWTALLGSATIVSSLVDLIGSHSGVHGTGLHPIGDASARGAVLGGLILLVSLAMLIIHLRKGISLARTDASPSSPSKRIEQSYVSAVSFVSVLVAVVAVIAAVYLVFRIIAPGVFQGTGRVPDLRNLLDDVYVALAAVVILRGHLKLSLPQLWKWPLREARVSGEPSAPTVGP